MALNINSIQSIAGNDLDISAGGNNINMTAAILALTGAMTISSTLGVTGLATLASVDINGGNIDGTTIGGATPATGTFLHLLANGNTTLGDAVGDTVTVNAGTMSVPNDLNIDSNTLVIDAGNNRLGAGVASPVCALEVAESASNSGVRVGAVELVSLPASLGARYNSNMYYDGGNNRARATGFCGAIGYASNGAMFVNVAAASVAAGNQPSLTQPFEVQAATPNNTLVLESGGNVIVGGNTAGANAVAAFHLYNGTAPTGSITDGVILYSEDVAASAELKVRDEGGNIATLSPHNFLLIPQGPSEELAWSYYGERGGKAINVDMLRAIRLIEKLTGEKLVHLRKVA